MTQKIDLCEGGLQLAEIVTKNVSEPDLTPRMRYIMVQHDKLFRSRACHVGGIDSISLECLENTKTAYQ